MKNAKVVDVNSQEYMLGQQIRNYRMKKGLSQYELADLMDMDRACITKYENGTKGEMGFKTLLKFAEALDISVEILLGIKNDDLDEKTSQLNEENRAILNSVCDGLLLKQKMMG